jgi:hypothetical protein
MHLSLPNDGKWTYTTDAGELVVNGSHIDILKGSAVLPPSEVLAVFGLIDYLSEQIARCNAAAP